MKAREQEKLSLTNANILVANGNTSGAEEQRAINMTPTELRKWC